MKHDKFPVPEQESPGSISLTDLLMPIWEARKMVLALVILAVVCGVGWTTFNAKYKSEGFFQFGGPVPIPAVKAKDDKGKEKEPEFGITLSDYKRFGASFATGERFDEYVQDKKLESTSGIADLRRTIARNGIAGVIEPIYPFTKVDARELMELPKGSSNNVIGLRINYQDGSPQVAQQMVGLLGRYAMDSIVYLIYSDALRFKHEEVSTRIIKLDNDIVENKSKLDEYGRRIAELKQIIARNPGSATEAPRQVVTITEDTARYLPPATQLVTTEIQAAEANEAIFKAKREQEQSKLYLEYYDRAKAILESTRSGETVLRGLEEAKQTVFKDKNLEDDIVKEVYNRISVENREAINVYLDKSRFIAGPTLPQKPTAKLSVTLVFSFLAGLVLAILFVFIRKWIRQNSEGKPAHT